MTAAPDTMAHLRELRHEVCEANKRIPRANLAALTWGNVSGVDREAGVFVIKPSGVPYDELTAEHMVVVELESGRVMTTGLRPSVDSETHRIMYASFPQIGGVTHTHSTYAVGFAQAARAIPVLGTTHADTFNGDITCTRSLSPAECATDYELNTGRVIVETVQGSTADPMAVPAVLVAHHGPFIWGSTATESLENAIVCERVAEMAVITLSLNQRAAGAAHVLSRHFTRKHGTGSYYGNPNPGPQHG